MLREYQAADHAVLKEIHRRRALSYEFPETSTPLVLVKLVQADGNDRPVAAVFGRLTAEIDLIIDPEEGSPLDRWTWLKMLAELAEARLWRAELDSAVAFVPIEIARAYGRRFSAVAFVPIEIARAYGRRFSRVGFEREPHVAFRRRVQEPPEWWPLLRRNTMGGGGS